MRIQKHREQWFKNRISQTIGMICKIGETSFVVRDKKHAHVIFVMQCELGYRYFDLKLKVENIEV